MQIQHLNKEISSDSYFQIMFFVVEQMVIEKDNINRYKQASDRLLNEFGDMPSIAVVAGSGIADTLDESNILSKIPYSKFPGLPNTSVHGHSGSILLYKVGSKKALIFSGRFHYYEGRTLHEINSLVSLCHLTGINRMLFTNAAGGINPLFKPGDLMIIEDIVDLMFPKCKNIYQVLEPANDHFALLNPKLSFRHSVGKLLCESNIKYKQGVYAAVTGPNYETRAEIRMLRKLGVDAVGMSTVPEIKAAYALGIEYMAFSLITNSAKEVKQEVSHAEVISEATKAAGKVRNIIELCIKAN